MEKQIGFAIMSDSLETYRKFRKDAEKLGWRYLESYTMFEQGMHQGCSCLWFDIGWEYDGVKEDEYCFSFSNPSQGLKFYLDIEDGYQKGLQHVKEIYEVKPKYYYVTERELEPDGWFEYATDTKFLSLYKIEDNKPILMVNTECPAESFAEDVLSGILLELGINKFELVKL